MEKEYFLQVKYPGLEHYKISNLGRVSNSKKILKQRLNKGGYPIVSLFNKDKKARVFLVHRLVAFTFLGDIKGDKKQVNHIDCDKTNNNAKNLEWVTPSYNTKHAILNGRRKKEDLVSLAKYASDKALLINKKRIKLKNVISGEEMIFESSKEASEFLGVHKSSAGFAARKKGRTVKGYTAEYI